MMPGARRIWTRRHSRLARGPKGSSSGLPVVKLGGAGGVRLENGTAVIS